MNPEPEQEQGVTVTKSSEGNMTAKEAICKNCGHGRNGHKDNWGGICVGCPCPGFEPVDAAESLPAQPEPAERCKDSHCFVDQTVHCTLGKGHSEDHEEAAMLAHWPNRDPVAPIEAQEKERCEHGVWLGDRCYECVYETEKPPAEPKPTPSLPVEAKEKKYWEQPHLFVPISFQGREQLSCEVCGYMECNAVHITAPVAEPKPTPSTPAESVSNPYKLPWEAMAGSIIDTVHMTNEDYVNEKLVEQLKRYFAPQPDSSSIPDENVWRHLVKRMYDECGSTKADDFIRRVQAGEHDVPSPWTRGSSSISSEPMPEQLVSEELLNAWADCKANIRKPLIRDLAIELQQWRKWAAAKGSK